MAEKCIFCKALSVVKNGLRKRKVRTKQSFLCKNCGKQFVEADGFERMRHNPKDVLRAIHMYNDGMSLFSVQNHLWQHDGVKVTLWTISKWHKKFSNFLKSNSFRCKAKVKRKATLG